MLGLSLCVCLLGSCGNPAAVVDTRSPPIDAGAAEGSPAIAGSAPPMTRPVADAATDAPATTIDAAARADSLKPAVWPYPELLSTPGWRNSQVPLCDVHAGIPATREIWADSRGVFALTSDACVPPDPEGSLCSPQGQALQGATLQFNDGTGWRRLVDSNANLIAGMFGFPNGPIALSTTDCALELFDVEANTGRCAVPGAGGYDLRSTFAVNSTLAYGALGYTFFEVRDGAMHVLVQEMSDSASAIWGNEDIAYLAGQYQPYIWRRASPDQVTALPAAPIAPYLSVWAFRENDVWFGNQGGQFLHYDGAAYRLVREQDAAVDEPIWALWGQDGQLFYLTSSRFGKLVDDQPQTLLTLPNVDGTGPYFTGLWGLSPTEIFLGFAGGITGDLESCRGVFALWFDGVAFHRF